MKKSKLWQAFLAVSISALAVPAFVQSQTAGGGSSAGSGMSSGATGSSRTMTSPSSPSMGSHDPAMPSSPGSTHPGGSTMGSSATPGSSTMGSSTVPGGSAGMGAATDQAKSEADRTLNQNMRQTLNTDSSLSASAKNVHFDTDNGKVTLRGTVPTEKDKKDLEAKVEKMSGVKNVDNQLQIAPSTSSAADRMGSSSDVASSGSSAMGSKSSPMGR
jgi:osmotically-inducible protein OsmY